MKRPRSFSLLTFLMLTTIAAIAVALYRANNEVAQTRADFERYSNEMGFIDVEYEDESKLHIRRLGGYPIMGFGFRYYIPPDKKYMLHVGGGVADPETGLPPVIFEAPLTSNNDQGTLTVSLEKLPTQYGKCWVVETTIDGHLSRRYCKDPSEFTWLQVYRSVFRDGHRVGGAVSRAKVGGHQPVSIISEKDLIDVYCHKEFHESALASIPPELMKQRKIFQIWLTPIANEEPFGKAGLPPTVE